MLEKRLPPLPVDASQRDVYEALKDVPDRHNPSVFAHLQSVFNNVCPARQPRLARDQRASSVFSQHNDSDHVQPAGNQHHLVTDVNASSIYSSDWDCHGKIITDAELEESTHGLAYLFDHEQQKHSRAKQNRTDYRQTMLPHLRNDYPDTGSLRVTKFRPQHLSTDDIVYSRCFPHRTAKRMETPDHSHKPQAYLPHQDMRPLTDATARSSSSWPLRELGLTNVNTPPMTPIAISPIRISSIFKKYWGLGCGYIDHGCLAWAQVFATTIVAINTIGMLPIFSLLQGYYSRVIPPCPTSVLVLPAALRLCLLIGLHCTIKPLARQGWYYFLVLASSILILGGFFALSYVEPSSANLAWIIIFQGLLISGGQSLLFNAAIVSLTRWFNHRRWIALTIVAVGAGAGSIGYAMLFEAVLDQQGLASSLRVIAIAVAASLAAAGLLLREPPQGWTGRTDSTQFDIISKI